MGIRILVVDDHSVVRRGLSAVIATSEDLELVGEAANGRDAVCLCHRLCPDVVLMDLVMPDMDGVEATRVILQENPDTKVIALTSFTEKELVQSALRAGATSYLVKNVSAEELVEAIRAATDGRSSLSPEAARSLVQEARREETPCFELTSRELEILSLLPSGLANSEIAEQLHVSTSTVKYHVSNILSKLGVTTRVEAVAIAVKHGLIAAD